MPILFESEHPLWQIGKQRIRRCKFLNLQVDSRTARRYEIPFGELDGYYVGAARSGENWFVGGVNTVLETTVTVDFSFLDSGKTYEAEIFINDATDNQKVVRRVVDITRQSKEMLKWLKTAGLLSALPPRGKVIFLLHYPKRVKLFSSIAPAFV